jgi:hypothetical protein
MAEGDAAPKRSGLGFWKLSLGVATGTILGGLVLMGIRHLVVIIRGSMNKKKDDSDTEKS